MIPKKKGTACFAKKVLSSDRFLAHQRMRVRVIIIFLGFAFSLQIGFASFSLLFENVLGFSPFS